MSSQSDNEKEAAKTAVHTEQERAETPVVFDAEMERRAIRKLDWHIIPMVMWIYLMNFMDRGRYPDHQALHPTDFEQLALETLVYMVWKKSSAFPEINFSWLCPFFSSLTVYVP